MSIQHLCDSHVVVYRATELRDEFGDTVFVWEPLAAPAGLNARADQAWAGTLADHGPGEQPGAMRRWFLVEGFDVEARDVVLVETGPEAGALLRVESVTKPTNPFVIHHKEINVIEWKGSLTEPAMES